MRRFVSSVSKLLLTTGLASALFGGNAILECTADASSTGGPASGRARELRTPGSLILNFNTWNVYRWNIDTAELFLHISKGQTPASVEVAAVPDKWDETHPPDVANLKYVPHDVRSGPQNWITIRIQASLAQEFTSGKAHGLAIRFKGPDEVLVHARESGSFPPYLIVAGGQ